MVEVIARHARALDCDEIDEAMDSWRRNLLMSDKQGSYDSIENEWLFKSKGLVTYSDDNTDHGAEDEPIGNVGRSGTSPWPNTEVDLIAKGYCRGGSNWESSVSRVTNSLESVGDFIEKSPTVDVVPVDEGAEVSFDGGGGRAPLGAGCEDIVTASAGHMKHPTDSPFCLPVLENHDNQQQQLVRHCHDRLDDDPDSPPPVIKHSSVMEKDIGRLVGRLETTPHSIKPGCGVKISQLDSSFNTMHLKGQYNLFVNVHFSTLLDALDLCMYNLPIVPFERLNIIPETSSLEVSPNAIMGNQNNQLAILNDQIDSCDDVVISARSLVIMDDANMEMILEPKETKLGVDCLSSINRIEK